MVGNGSVVGVIVSYVVLFVCVGVSEVGVIKKDEERLCVYG